MNGTTRILGLTVIGALLATGAVAAPVQAAAPVKPVTKGYVALAFDVPGLPAESFVAVAPARTTMQGLSFPISSVVAGTPMRVNLSGFLGIDGVSTGAEVPLYAMLNKADGRLVISIPTDTEPVVFFFGSDMKVNGPTTKVSLAKRTRTTTTTWTGDLRVGQDGPEVAETLNSLFGTSYFTPGGSVGRLTMSTSVTAPCRNAACTK